MVVAQQYQKFMQYRDKVSALRIASEEVGKMFSSMEPPFSSENKHLLRRGGISQSMADMILRGESRIPRLIKDLNNELDNELEDLDKLLGKTNSMSVEVFKQFQKSALSHQHKQSVILKALYEMGVNFFHGIDGQIHARHETMEKSHVEFGQHVLSLFEALASGQRDKGTIAKHWMDALEHLILFLKDESVLGLSQETIQHFVNSDMHPFPRLILSKYYHIEAGKGYVDRLHEVGYKRPAIVQDDVKKTNYYDLSEDKQKEVDKIIKESLLYLLKDSTDVFIPRFNSSLVFYWDAGDSNKDYSFKHIIENEVYKSDRKVTKDQIKVLHQLLEEFKVKVLIGACKRMFRFTDSDDSLGYHSFRIAQSDFDNTIITVGKFYDKEFYENDKNETNIKSMITLLTQILDEKHPEKHSYVISLLEDDHNKSILYKKEGGKDDDEDEKWFKDAPTGSIPDFVNEISSFSNIRETLLGDTYWDGDSIKNVENFKSQLTQIMLKIKIVGKTINELTELEKHKSKLPRLEAVYKQLSTYLSNDSFDKNEITTILINLENLYNELRN